MRATLIKNHRRERRASRVRTKLRRVSTLPRLCVSRSSKHIAAQVIDDASGRTIVHATTTAKSLASDLTGKTKSQRAAFIGTEIAKKALEKGVSQVVLDRGFARFHGRVKALADAARAGGLKF
jgi:large subunit ribosomal protein L18